MNPDKLHLASILLLQRLRPLPDSLAGVKEAIRSVWAKRQDDMDELRRILIQKLRRIDERNATLMNRMLDSILDENTFKEHNARLREESEQAWRFSIACKCQGA